MIDTHCHLLPGVDDGPRSVGEALDLARGLVAAGVEVVVCTPHFSRRFPTDHAVAKERLEMLRGALDEAGITLRCRLAAELSSAAALDASPADLRERQLGNGYVLVELEPDTPAGLVELAFSRLDELRLVPVFAHPERCRAVRDQPHVLDEARGAGALVQVVASSLRGSWGGAVGDAAWRLLDSGRVDLIASDAHRPRHAGARLALVLERIAARVGRDPLVAMTEARPASVIGDASWAR